jgi:hypothetical protein
MSYQLIVEEKPLTLPVQSTTAGQPFRFPGQVDVFVRGYGAVDVNDSSKLPVVMIARGPDGKEPDVPGRVILTDRNTEVEILEAVTLPQYRVKRRGGDVPARAKDDWTGSMW